MYFLFKLDLRRLSTLDQEIILQKFNLQPYKIRLLQRISIFAYKLLNKQILKKFRNNLIDFVDQTKSIRLINKNAFVIKDIFSLPFVNTMHGKFRLSFFLPNFVNKIIRNSYNLSYNEFSKHLNDNLLLFYNDFNNFFYK